MLAPGEPEDADTLVLAEPLTTALLVDDFVGVVAGGQVLADWYAHVSLGEGDDVLVEIPFAERDRWPLGIFDDPVPVLISDDLLRLEATPGRLPTIDGSMIDPETLPDPTIPTEAPAASPIPVILPGPATAIVTWTRDADARTRYNIYAATSDTAPLVRSVRLAPLVLLGLVGRSVLTVTLGSPGRTAPPDRPARKDQPVQTVLPDLPAPRATRATRVSPVHKATPDPLALPALPALTVTPAAN